MTSSKTTKGAAMRDRASNWCAAGKVGSWLHWLTKIVRRRAHGFGRHGTLLRQQAEADEAIGQLAIGLLRHQFVAGMPPPEINSADLKKLARGAQKTGLTNAVGALRSLGGDRREKFLKCIVGTGAARPSGDGAELPSTMFRVSPLGQDRVLAILTSD